MIFMLFHATFFNSMLLYDNQFMRYSVGDIEWIIGLDHLASKWVWLIENAFVLHPKNLRRFYLLVTEKYCSHRKNLCL